MSAENVGRVRAARVVAFDRYLVRRPRTRIRRTSVNTTVRATSKAAALRALTA